MLEIFASTPENLGLDNIAAFAQRVEAMGYDGLFVSDAIHDGLLLACQALSATRRIKVSTSVLVAFPRSPMNVALASWDLQKMSGGRFELGLGTQIKQNIEDRYSSRWLPPAAGMREYLQSMRAIFHSFRTGEPLNYVGEHYRFTRLQPFFNPGPIDAPDVPLMLGAVGPKMLELVGQEADGIHTHPTNTSVRYLREVITPQIAQGLAKRDPARQRPLISASQFVATGPDQATVSAERERFRDMLAFLFSTPAYWPSLELFGWGSVGENLLQLTREKRWKDMPSVFSDEVLDQFLVSAQYEELPEALASRFVGVADRVTLTVPHDPAHDAAVSLAISAIRARSQSAAA
ncbi:probable F420-dependent oxidoreductase, MSMEG_2256 family [Pseudomonas linyingensis]|uniref:Probable F420-dependent oxidoreductase, MSMEG_2256 family n=1 Tax=Pseudomonas linyingensis TaxID=915471 RepID=A0A1H6ZVJ6_9PSED|nr:TIGR03617 family F420-dependent LLM class oxidoreductase [Pseudomonas linyingensis]SEJ52815.1 probable F420-dependent oxidoreductase, MSMEG_2256 family [Pseudomonas linyingensis]